jgi:hypothetical protein
MIALAAPMPDDEPVTTHTFLFMTSSRLGLWISPQRAQGNIGMPRAAGIRKPFD